MGRFYTTDKPQFLDNFIYQPPWELIQQNNMLEADNYSKQQETLNLLKNIDINYIDEVDGDNALAKKQEFESAINPLVDLYKKDSNSPEAREQVRQLTKKLQEDVMVGDIYKIQKNKEKYDEFKAVADTIKNPLDKAVFLSQFDKTYLQPNEDGTRNNALNKQFDYLGPQERIDTNEFYTSDSYKQLEADITAIANAGHARGYLTDEEKTSKALKEKDIETAFKGWLASKGVNSKEWIDYQTKVVGISNLLNDKGEISYDKNSYFGDMIESSKAYAYEQKAAKKNIAVDEKPLREAELTWQKQKFFAESNAAAQQQAKPFIADNKESGFYFKYTKEGQEVVKQLYNEKVNIAKKAGMQTTAGINKYIKGIYNNPGKYPEQYRQLAALDARLNLDQKSGLNYLKQLNYTKEEVEKAQAFLDRPNLAKEMATKKMYVDFGDIRGKQFFSKGANKGQKTTLQEMVGTRMTTGPYKGRVIKAIRIVDGSTTIMPGAKSNGEMGLQTTLEFDFAKKIGEDGEEEVKTQHYTAYTNEEELSFEN